MKLKLAAALAPKKAASHPRQAGRLLSVGATYLAFILAVVTCTAAAAAVASHDLPLMLGGL